MTRTHDLLITNQLLYRLSYISIFTFGVADLILTNQLLYRLSYTSIKIYEPYPKRLIPLQTRLIISQFSYSVNTFFPPILYGKSQAKNAVLFQQTILRYFVHFGQREKATRQSPAGSLCFIVLFPCYFRVLCVRFSLKYERTVAARPPPPSTRPAPCSHSARLKPSLGSCSSRFGFARSPPVIPRRASSPSGATAG